ncbi:hypothetical protein [Alkalimarinus sediminis]|uniref:Lipoprotein n=1 Tax=Alkalimarinus sediminis TaxID=1632866 RepID=A0A9E8HH16_9ALTE|nr:hypothetical protein [Alkalimarinus sediminis]UZW74520.1 hypothetical protein NNL22_16075 [Alkalimarinus sediminis]
MIIRNTLLLVSVLFLTSCATNKKSEAERWHSSDSKKIERTQSLYSCGKFYKVVAGQRKEQDEKDRYLKFSELAGKLAENLTPVDKILSNKEHSQLYRRYDFQAHLEITEWIKNIGNDKTGELFNDLTISCLKTIQREELFFATDGLNERIKK